MLVTILIRRAELMMDLKRRDKGRKYHQAKG
jgi:hypothetical protein